MLFRDEVKWDYSSTFSAELRVDKSLLDSSSKTSVQSISQGPLQIDSRKTVEIPERGSQKNLLSAPSETSASCCLCSMFTSRFSQVVTHLLSSFLSLAPARERSSCRKSAMKKVEWKYVDSYGKVLAVSSKLWLVPIHFSSLFSENKRGLKDLGETELCTSPLM